MRYRQAFLGLFAAAALATGLGCASKPPLEVIAERQENLREVIGEVVIDPDRAQRMQLDLDRMVREFEGFRAKAQPLLRRIMELQADYGTSRETLAVALAEFDDQHKAARGRLLESHLALASLATADEWSKLAKHERKVFEAIRRATGEGS